MKGKLIACFLSGLFANVYSQGTQLLRQPTISAESVVFVYANDLWKTSLQGGNALRLTSDEGSEAYPHFSPDGKSIAFSGQYDGNTDVFVIPASGGEPIRLTFHPGADIVQGWTPEGKVVFSSARESHPTQINKFYTIGIEGGWPQSVDIPRASYGEISEDGKHIAYTPIDPWDSEWRNYRGGQAMPVWIVNLETKELQRTPQKDRERHLDPVWYQGKVFFISERDYAANIWSYDPGSGQEQQHTFHKQFDVKSLDAGPAGIIYEQGGYLHLLNPSTDETRQLAINVQGDMNFARARWESVKGDQLSNPQLSPNGKRALFEHRGEVFTVPVEKGTWRNLSNSPGVADRFPVWSPKGTKIAWFSDAKGEYELVVSDQKGVVQKTYSLPEPTFFFRPAWSPDEKNIAFTDTDYTIWVLNLEKGTVTKVAADQYAHPNRDMNPVWSPDGKWIAYSQQLNSHFKALFAYNVQSGKTLQLTDGMADATSPAWDASGSYLYFLASTDYGLQSGWLDMSSVDVPYSRSLYALVLAGDGKAPEKIIYISEQLPNSEGTRLHKYIVADLKAEAFAEGISDFVVSASREQIMVRQGGNWKVAKTSSKSIADADALETDLKLKVVPTEEYEQIFREGWRFMRDFLYVDNVHGAPWDAVYSWYSPWIKHVRHRTDLNYVVDILSGEVAIGHSFVSGGDQPDLDRVPVGLLGCDFALENGRYRIKKIYDGEQWNPEVYAPLGLPGLGIEEGDYLLAVNGKELREGMNPFELLEQTAGREIYLTIGKDARGNTSRDVLVKPVSNENGLRTFAWIEENRKKVDSLSDGKLAYVYVPNTSGRGFEYFNRYYFAQQDRKGVIIDERNNGGGYAADYMIDIMDRELFGYFNSKTESNRPWTTPMAGIWGPKVMLINESSGSGGDLLPYMFHAKELGPLIGTRTWGGLVGTWDTPRFIDGGRMVAPRGGFFDVKGEWAVEGEGVSPDIEVIQDPAAVSQGKDPQLDKAIEVALQLLTENGIKLQEEPAAPIRWKRPEGFEINPKEER